MFPWKNNETCDEIFKDKQLIYLHIRDLFQLKVQVFLTLIPRSFTEPQRLCKEKIYLPKSDKGICWHVYIGGETPQTPLSVFDLPNIRRRLI